MLVESGQIFSSTIQKSSCSVVRGQLHDQTFVSAVEIEDVVRFFEKCLC